MQIVLQNKQQKERCLRIPNGLLLNRITSFILVKTLNKRGISLKQEQIKLIVASLNSIRKRHPDWVLLEAEDANGDQFKIIL